VNETFRLEAHIDDGIVASLADNLALEDATAGYLLDFASEQRVKIAVSGFLSDLALE
jgi:hypothetical protein